MDLRIQMKISLRSVVEEKGKSRHRGKQNYDGTFWVVGTSVKDFLLEAFFLFSFLFFFK